MAVIGQMYLTTKPNVGEETLHSTQTTELVSLCLKTNAEMVPKIPSYHYMLLM